MRKQSAQAWSGPITDGCGITNVTHKSKGSLTGRRQGPARKGLALQGQRALEEKDEVFIVLFDYSSVSGNDEKVRRGVHNARGDGNTMMIVVANARSDLSSCHLDG